MILPFASVYPKLSCRGSRLDRCGFLFLLGDLQVFLRHIKISLLSAWRAQKPPGEMLTSAGSYTTIPPNVQAPPFLKAEHHHHTEETYYSLLHLPPLLHVQRGEVEYTNDKVNQKLYLHTQRNGYIMLHLSIGHK